MTLEIDAQPHRRLQRAARPRPSPRSGSAPCVSPAPADVSSAIAASRPGSRPAAAVPGCVDERRRARAALARPDAEPPLAPVVGDVQLAEERRVRPVVVALLVRRVREPVDRLLPPRVAGVGVERRCSCSSAAPSRCGPRRRPCRPRSCSCAASGRCGRPTWSGARTRSGCTCPSPTASCRGGSWSPSRPARPPAGAGRRPCSRGPRRSATARRGRRAAWSRARRPARRAARRGRASRPRTRSPPAPRRARRGTAAPSRTASCSATAPCSPRPPPRAPASASPAGRVETTR